MATDELAAKLSRREKLNEEPAEGEEGVQPVNKSLQVFNPYTEFKEFSRKQIKEFEKTFKK